jgi:hypothetical protein
LGSLFIARARFRRRTSGGSAAGDDQAILHVRPYRPGGGGRYRCHYRIKGRGLYLGLSLLLMRAGWGRKLAEAKRYYRKILFFLFRQWGQNDDRSGTGGFCGVRIRKHGRSATNPKAIPSGYILHEIR